MEPTNPIANNPEVTSTPVAQPVATPVSTMTSESNVITDQKSNGSNKMIFIVIVIVILVAIAGGVYWLMNQTSKEATQTQSLVQETNASLTELNQELNSLNVEEVTNQEDITALDQDLQSLQD